MRYARASLEDQSKLGEFLQQFPGDYLRDHLSTYVSQQPGGLYIALDGEAIVAISVISMPSTKEAYLSGMRVAPDRQGQGVGKAFAEFGVQEARRLGAEVIRAMVEKENAASRHILGEILGFVPLVDWHVGRVEDVQTLPGPTLQSGPAWSVDQERIETFWNDHGREMWAGRELWVPRSWDRKDIRDRIEAGVAAVYPQDQEQPVQALALYQIRNQERLDVYYFWGDGAGGEDLCRYLGEEARAWGVTTLRFGLGDANYQRFVQNLGLPVQNQWQGTVLEYVPARLPSASHESSPAT